jgi:hypothetical protein
VVGAPYDGGLFVCTTSKQLRLHTLRGLQYTHKSSRRYSKSAPIGAPNGYLNTIFALRFHCVSTLMTTKNSPYFVRSSLHHEATMTSFSSLVAPQNPRHFSLSLNGALLAHGDHIYCRWTYFGMIEWIEVSSESVLPEACQDSYIQGTQMAERHYWFANSST